MKSSKLTLSLMATILVLASPASLLAQTESKTGSKTESKTKSVDAESWRAKPPELPEPRPFKLPEVETYRMDNGLEVKLVEDHRFPYVTAFIGFKAGMTLEGREQNGVSNLTASMITEGTGKRSSKEIASQIAFIGGGLSANTGYDFTILSGSALSNYQDRLFELLSDVLLNPSFPEDELKLKKANWLQELVMQRSKPSFLLEERFRKVVFGGHPYGVVAPHPDRVSAIKREDLVAFHKEHYIPNDAILIVLGDFDRQAIKETIKARLGDWQKGTRAVATLPETPRHEGRHIYLVNRPGSVQTSLKLGNLGIKRTDPDYFNILVMNEILGGAAHSRLFVNIREDKGFTYGAYSHASAKVHPDEFSASADVRTEVTGPSIQEFLYELERIRNLKVSDEELDTAKRYIAGQFQLKLETQSGLAGRLLESSLYDLPADYLETFSKKLMAVTVDDVRLAARRLIQSEDLVIAVVGDADRIRPDLEMFAPVEVYSAEGELIKGEKGI